MLINRKAIKRLALDASTELRGGKFTRVSGEFFERVEGKIKEFVRAEIRSLPSVGKTIK